MLKTSTAACERGKKSSDLTGPSAGTNHSHLTSLHQDGSIQEQWECSAAQRQARARKLKTSNNNNNNKKTSFKHTCNHMHAHKSQSHPGRYSFKYLPYCTKTNIHCWALQAACPPYQKAVWGLSKYFPDTHVIAAMLLCRWQMRCSRKRGEVQKIKQFAWGAGLSLLQHKPADYHLWEV